MIAQGRRRGNGLAPAGSVCTHSHLYAEVVLRVNHRCQDWSPSVSGAPYSLTCYTPGGACAASTPRSPACSSPLPSSRRGTERWNLQHASRGEPVELYDLENDPSQSKNIADSHPHVVKELHAEFVELMNQCPVREDRKEVRLSL